MAELEGEEKEKAKNEKHKVPFNYGQAESEDEALKVCEVKGWSLLEFVNERLRDNAKSYAYQRFMAKHKPSKLSDEQMVNRMITTAIQMGIPEDKARAHVESLLASK